MKIVKLNFVLLFVLSFFMSCQDSNKNSTSNELEAQTANASEMVETDEKTDTEISMDSTQSYCHVVKVFEENEKTLITVDFIQVNWIEEEGGMETYEEVNENPKLRTFILNSSTVLLPPNDLDVGRMQRIIKQEDELNEKRTKEEGEHHQRYEITVKDGFVTELLIDMAG